MNEQINSLSNGRLVIISNRLPIVISKEESHFKINPGSGGLVTAIAPILKNRGGVWIGCPGIFEKGDFSQITTILKKENNKTGFQLHPIFLSQEENKMYYEGFSNEIIWPLFHDLQSDCHFDPDYWHVYQDVNRKFAEEIKQNVNAQDFIWVHDYHLMLVGQELRKLKVSEKLGFFLHIPFPSIDILIKLPWRFQILHALLEFDLIGFQTLRDQRNFIQCVKRLLPDVKLARKHQIYVGKVNNREVRVGAFPISIDYQEFSKMAAGKQVTNQVGLNRESLKDQKLVFSCDRLDITKGIPYRLEAIRHLLKNNSNIHEKVTFFQIIVPSRTEIPRYVNLKKEIDRLIGEINSQYTKPGWVPIQYMYQFISREELLSFYRIAEIALITPVKDGMNLVAKEYVASNVHENGVLILSEFAGVATQFQNEALLINPYDIEGLADILFTALMLPPKDKKKRMRKMRRQVHHYDVFWWVHVFLKAAISKDLNDFPIIEDYIPNE